MDRQVVVVVSDDERWASRGMQPVQVDPSAYDWCQVCGARAAGDILWCWKEARRCTPCLLQQGGLRYVLVDGEGRG